MRSRDATNVSTSIYYSTVRSPLLSGRWLKHQIVDQTISEYLECLQVCDYQRFAPSNSTLTDMKTLYDKAKTAIVNVEKII